MTLTINGRTVEARPDETILEIARRHGIDIPALCADERLAPFDSCGVCVVEVQGKGVVKACSTPAADGMVVDSDAPAAREVRKAALELLLSNHWGDCVGPCQEACPAHTDCQAYVSLTANGRFEEGLQILYEALPLPATFGRICPAPCEDECRREIAEEPVQIRQIKRFLGDLPLHYIPSCEPNTGKKVAVVGGGPAGLSAAYFLRRRGHDATVFDAMPRMGGMLRYGIPDYRLPQSVLDRELDVLERMGVAFRNGVRLGEHVTLAGLEASYDAVFLGLGAWGVSTMGLPGEDHAAVMQGTEFLRRVNEGNPPRLPKRAVVIGGGNTAMDAARCARRLGADVTVLYRRSRDEMPALPHEVREAEEEGVKLDLLVQPIAFEAKGTKLAGVRCVRVELGAPDASGRRRPVPVKGSEFVVPAETALLAVGQTIDGACLEELRVEQTKSGAPVVDSATGRTSRARVFAGGDFVTGPSIAVEAVGAGRRAADAIDRLLTTGETQVPAADYVHVRRDVTRQDLGDPPPAPQIRPALRPAAERVRDFGEFESALDETEAKAAGHRCLECGCMAFNDCLLREHATGAQASQDAYAGETKRSLADGRHPFLVRETGKCVSCGRCLRVCADVCGISAIDFVGRGIDTEVQAPFNLAWQDSDCKSCGACVDACPTGALSDRVIFDKQVPLDLTATPTVCVLCGLGCDIDALTRNERLLRIAPSDCTNVLCARGRYAGHVLQHAARITSPMIRRGSALVPVSWSDALAEAARRLTAARGSVLVSGTGTLTSEEGWVVSRIAAALAAGTPVLETGTPRGPVAIAGGRTAQLAALDEPGLLIVVVGPRGGWEKVVLDVRLRQAMRQGSAVIDVGGEVPGATIALAPDALPRVFERLAGTAGRDGADVDALVSSLGPRQTLVLVDEQHASPAASDAVARFVAANGNARLLVVPRSANAEGLRRLGFGDEFRRSARAWIAVGSDPLATEVGRQSVPGIDTLVAVSALATPTTARAHVVLPMRLPFEARGSIVGAAGKKRLSAAARGPLEEETWEVLVRLAHAVGDSACPASFESLADEASRAAAENPVPRVLRAGAAASLSLVVDRRLGEAGV